MSDDKIVSKLPIRNKRGDDNDKPYLVPPPAAGCTHKSPSIQYTIDRNAEKCFCGDCGAEVSPMFVLEQMMHSENRVMKARALYKEEMKRLSERSRTTCEHCGKMTAISRR